ncbi:MAG: rod shape-determining protein MreC [Victivallales bacterium]|nr:rod shape-determining protein MreC [Victivallales bacterium]
MPPRHNDLFKPLVLTALVLLVAGVSLTSWGRRLSAAMLMPFVGVADWAAEGLVQSVRMLQPGHHARKDQLHSLETRIAELETTLAMTDDLRRQNAELRQAANLPPVPDWRGVLAEVISRDPERWNERMMIGAGIEEGLVTGAVVLVDGQVIGRVLHTYRHTAEVVTILSEECRFGVRLAKAGATGILRGTGAWRRGDSRSGFLVDYLPKELVVSPGEDIVTSGLGGWMPDGLPVGNAVVAEPASENALNIIEAAYGQLQCVPCKPLGGVHFVVVMVPRYPTEGE